MDISALIAYKQQSITTVEGTIATAEEVLAAEQADLARLETLNTQSVFTLEEIDFLNVQSA